MGFFSRPKPEENIVTYDDYEYDYDPDRGYNNQTEAHSLDTGRPGVTAAQFSRLWKLNIAAFVFQTASAAAIYYFIDPENKFNFYTNYPLSMDVASNGTEDIRIDMGPDTKLAFSYSIGWLSAVFLTLSALDHLLVSLPPFKGMYERGVRYYYLTLFLFILNTFDLKLTCLDRSNTFHVVYIFLVHRLATTTTFSDGSNTHFQHPLCA